MIAILNNIRSNHNVGSIFRTADGAGFEKIYLCGITPSPIDRFRRKNSALSKVSLGAEKFLEWEKAESFSVVFKKLKLKGYKIIAIEQSEHAKNIFESKVNIKKTALVFGEEVDGLPKKIIDKCDEIFEIPMMGKKESLNVSVAFGVAAYQLISNSIV